MDYSLTHLYNRAVAIPDRAPSSLIVARDDRRNDRRRQHLGSGPVDFGIDGLATVFRAFYARRRIDGAPTGASSASSASAAPAAFNFMRAPVAENVDGAHRFGVFEMKPDEYSNYCARRDTVSPDEWPLVFEVLAGPHLPPGAAKALAAFAPHGLFCLNPAEDPAVAWLQAVLDEDQRRRSLSAAGLFHDDERTMLEQALDEIKTNNTKYAALSKRWPSHLVAERLPCTVAGVPGEITNWGLPPHEIVDAVYQVEQVFWRRDPTDLWRPGRRRDAMVSAVLAAHRRNAHASETAPNIKRLDTNLTRAYEQLKRSLKSPL